MPFASGLEIGTCYAKPMFKRLFIASVVSLVATAVFAQAYRWVDEDGVVHFSDRPGPGAEEIQLPASRAASRPVQRSIPVSAASAAASSAPPAAEEEPFSYESFVVATPVAEETLWNIEGVLNVTLDLQPGLQQGHRVRVYFDGEPQIVSSLSFELQEVFRGVHNLQAEVVDEAGKLMIRSITNRFYVQQNVIQRGGRN